MMLLPSVIFTILSCPLPGLCLSVFYSNKPQFMNDNIASGGRKQAIDINNINFSSLLAFCPYLASIV